MSAEENRTVQAQPSTGTRLLDYRNQPWIPNIDGLIKSGVQTSIVVETGHSCGTVAAQIHGKGRFWKEYFVSLTKYACQPLPFPSKDKVFWGEQPPFMLFECGGRYHPSASLPRLLCQSGRPVYKLRCTANHLTRTHLFVGVPAPADCSAAHQAGRLIFRSLPHYDHVRLGFPRDVSCPKPLGDRLRRNHSSLAQER